MQDYKAAFDAFGYYPGGRLFLLQRTGKRLSRQGFLRVDMRKAVKSATFWQRRVNVKMLDMLYEKCETVCLESCELFFDGKRVY